MRQNDLIPVQDYLDTLPEPATFREKLLCWWSNLVDTALILAYKIWRKEHAND
jgi:hypothetical protein